MNNKSNKTLKKNELKKYVNIFITRKANRIR